MTTFKQALLDANLEEFRDIPTEKEIDLEISPRFQEKVEELIRKAVKIRYRSSAVLKKVLLVAVIAGLLILTACAVPAVRETIIDFFFKDEGTHYSFTYDPEQAANAPDALETVYAPTDIPEGFDLMVEDISALGVALMWRNSDDVWINYIQSIMPDNPTLGDGGGFNAEGAKAEWITLEECRVRGSKMTSGSTTPGPAPNMSSVSAVRANRWKLNCRMLITAFRLIKTW